MQQSQGVRIDLAAAKELARWKSLFADEVCEQAVKIATQSGEPSFVTLSHYRQAAEAALRSLSAAIQKGNADDARQKAA